MPNKIGRYLAIVLCLFIANTPVKAAEKLLFATGEWLPYTSKNLDGGGVLVELVRSVVLEMGMRPEFIFFPWKRAERLVERGKVFAAFPYGKNADRLSRFQFSDNFFSAPTVFFYRRGELPIESYDRFEDLRPYRIGGNRGYNYVQWFEKAGLKSHLAESQDQLIKMLEKGRIDLAAIDRGAGWMTIDTLFPGRRHEFSTMKRSIEQTDEEMGSHLMVSPGYPNQAELISKFNQALRVIRKNGMYAKILEKYKIEGGENIVSGSEN